VSESPDQIRKRIEALTDFEVKYTEFVRAVEEFRRTGNERWSPEEFEERKREILKAAPRADAAVKASGASYLVVREPPAIGGQVRSSDLSSQVMDFDSGGFDFENDGLDIPRRILETIPSQLGALEMRLEEAEAAPVKATKPVEAARRSATPQQEWEVAPNKKPGHGAWIYNPWVVGIGCAVIGGVVLAVILALAH
jgi:hypothetical protein